MAEGLVEAESTVVDERLPATWRYVPCVKAVAEAEFEATYMEGYKVVAISRIQDANWYMQHVEAQVAAAKASPSEEVSSKPPVVVDADNE